MSLALNVSYISFHMRNAVSRQKEFLMIIFVWGILGYSLCLSLFLFLLPVLEIEPRVLILQGKYSVTELHPSSIVYFLRPEKHTCSLEMKLYWAPELTPGMKCAQKTHRLDHGEKNLDEGGYRLRYGLCWQSLPHGDRIELAIALLQ